MLMEDETLGEEQMGEIVKTYQTLEYVSKLNKSLLLLSKIDNSQYADSKEINLNEVLHRYVEDYQEVYHYRSITLDLQEQGIFRVWMNETLAVVLITNLLKNAFVHNVDEGSIRIEVSSSGIRFGNSALGSDLDGTRIFERFYQGNKKKEGSTGLGLAIVDAICRQCGLQIRYRFAQDMHWFELSL
jgi:signal transduction histidine kinase